MSDGQPGAWTSYQAQITRIAMRSSEKRNVFMSCHLDDGSWVCSFDILHWPVLYRAYRDRKDISLGIVHREVGNGTIKEVEGVRSRDED